MNDFSKDTYAVVAFFLVLACNLMGNSLVIYFISKKERTVTDHLLLNLAISDMIFAIFEAPHFIPPQLIPDSERGSDALCKLFLKGNISKTIMFVCIGTMMVLSIERYIAICRPLSFKRWFSSRKIKFFIMLIWVTSVLYTLPVYLSHGRKCSVATRASQVIYTTSITLAGFELLFLMILSIKIYMALWIKPSAIQPTDMRKVEERKRKKKITLGVLAVIVSYLVAYIPYFVITVVVTYNRGKKGIRKFAIYQELTTILLTINTALDPYLYSLQNSRFRIFLRKLLLCRCGKQELPVQQSRMEQGIRGGRDAAL